MSVTPAEPLPVEAEVLFMNGPRLLVVDDAPDDRALLVDTLETHGFEVDQASGRNEGVERVRAGTPDLVVCDVTAVDGEGLELLEYLSRQAPDLPVVVVTGDADMAGAVRALRLGAADYLSKPLSDAERVIHAVESALERARLRQENSRVKQELESANQTLRDYLEELQQDQRAGRQVQLGMLPPSPLTIDGFRLQHRIIPSLFLSGDFVDYFPITERHFVFYIADVSGHGASSAFVTVLLKNFSRRLRREYRPRMLDDPAHILRWLNQDLMESHLDRHVTMFLGVVDAETDRLAFSNAGHFPCPVLTSDGVARTLELPGKPLGIFPQVQVESGHLDLPPRFSLTLFSDGVLEVLAADRLAEKEVQLERIAAVSDGDLRALCEALGLDADVEAPDDIACLMLARSP